MKFLFWIFLASLVKTSDLKQEAVTKTVINTVTMFIKKNTVTVTNNSQATGSINKIELLSSNSHKLLSPLAQLIKALL